MNYQDFVHPEDAAALEKLKAIPGFDKASRWLMDVGFERLYHGMLMAQNVRLSKTQLPSIYNLLPPVCEKFGIDEPEFYLEMNPMPNAFTFGDKIRFLVVTSGLLDMIKSEDELRSILAHECGHIVCRHSFYNALINALLMVQNQVNILGNLFGPLVLALMYWSRRSELSADRASVVYWGGADIPIKAMLRIAGGSSALTKDINVEEYAKQAQEYEGLRSEKTWDKILQGWAVMQNAHPFNAVRISEMRKWECGDTFRLLMNAMKGGSVSRYCPWCGRAAAEEHAFCIHCGHKLDAM